MINSHMNCFKYSVLTSVYLNGYNFINFPIISRGIPEYAILLCFLSGCVTIVLGILRLGFLVEFVSIPVVSGFTSAASVIIACSQIKNLLGLKIHGESFIEIWRVLASNIGQTRIPDLILSCCCILTLLTLKVIHRGTAPK